VENVLICKRAPQWCFKEMKWKKCNRY